MKRIMLVGIAVTATCLPLLSRAQESKSDAKSASEVLAMEEGVWDAEITTMMPGADGKVEKAVSKGVETNRLLAGKWIISDFKGEFGGFAFEGHGVNGFDEKKGKYVGTWVDTMSAQIDKLEGTYDEKTKTITLHRDSVNPGDGKPMKLRLETSFNDDGTRTFKNIMQEHGKKDFVQLVEIKYTKRK